MLEYEKTLYVNYWVGCVISKQPKQTSKLYKHICINFNDALVLTSIVFEFYLSTHVTTEVVDSVGPTVYTF